MSTNQSLQKALDYIEKNITEELSLYEISREAGFSLPHFYRLFKRLTGDTVGGYILRRRMAMAAKDLTDSSKSVSNIAYEYGFESHDVFTRAFTRVYGMPPNKYRHSSGPPPLKRVTILNNNAAIDEQQMKFNLVHTESFYVIGMECNAMQWDCDGAIGRLWSDFLTRVEEITQISSPMIMYGICEQETCEKEQFKYMAAVGVTNVEGIPVGMIKRCIRAQRFFQASVPDVISTPDAYSGTIGYAKSLGYEIEEYDTIEVYEEIFQDPEFNRFKLWISIQ